MHFSTPLIVSASLIGMAKAFNGEATFFEPGLGACGKTNTRDDFIVALSSSKYGNGNHCGGKIEVHYKGKSVRATVADKCPGCKTDDIDLSPAAFNRLADKSLGRIKVSWNFV